MKYLASENVWLSKNVYEDAETAYYEKLSKDDFASASSAGNIDTGAFKFIEKKIVDFEKSLDQVFEQLKSLALRVSAVEKLSSSSQSVHEINLNQQPQINPEASKADDDDDVDLFASDSEEESNEASKIREERLAAYAAKKSKKPALIAKSNIILDVKPWDDETDLKLMESSVRKIELDGLLWGASKLVPLAYGIKKLQISCVVEDDKVSIDWLTEQIEAIEELVQSVDIAAFNKI
ncbi:probable elongation factor 1-delta isoform X2 [Dendroctonus ponderosae]|uniref:Translation elongation factor EF1B beta/delta subunit guanine nucleotide exchange domain-containing protein n=1 Tax=Dendroctonus ponderosae TaxID=77166 RepID=A0AAR5PHM5_DENPD|nr:probable elongation factor 1-delta isoform X2 [Dendroctonus ponderosae]